MIAPNSEIQNNDDLGNGKVALVNMFARRHGNEELALSLAELLCCFVRRPALLLGFSDGLSTCTTEFRALSDR